MPLVGRFRTKLCRHLRRSPPVTRKAPMAARHCKNLPVVVHEASLWRRNLSVCPPRFEGLTRIEHVAQA